MVSIIRSAVISDEKRKLLPRSTNISELDLPEALPEELTGQTIRSPSTVASQNLGADALNSAVEQARHTVLTQIKVEAEAARELGRQRGLREGRLTGVEEVKQEFASEIGRVRSIADKLPQALKDGITDHEDTLVAIAFEAVCKILGDAAVTHDGVRAIVRQAATRTPAAKKITVRLHAADLALLTKAEILDAVLPSGITVSWAADKHVSLGGCLIEGDGGTLDARLETQIDRVRETLVTARQGMTAA